MALNKFTWENGTQVEPAKVEVGGVIYTVTDAQYEGETPLTASNLNNMQDILNANIEQYAIDFNTYSTSTEKKVGIWIDGKPIYRKTIDMGSMPNATYKYVNHNISNIDEIVNIYGIMRNPSNHTTTPLNMHGVSGIYGDNTVAVCRADRERATVACNVDYSTNNVAYITLEYTKTTD